MKTYLYIGKYKITESEINETCTKVGKTTKTQRIISTAAKRENLEDAFMMQAKQAKKDEKNTKRYNKKYAKRK